VAVAAALNVTEPAMTGIGGDMFCLYFDAKTKSIRALNGSGRAPKNTTVDQIRGELGMAKDNNAKIPTLSPLSVTVPGAAAGWVDTVEKFGSGKLTLEQILTPAIELAENGYPVSEFSARFVSVAYSECD
jgi:gamma-glutamyltranspeptidase / glutathione hydrolase